MVAQFEIKLAADLILQSLDLGIVKLEDGVTTDAHQMVMVAMSLHMVSTLVVGAAAKGLTAYQAARDQKVQGSVNGGPGDAHPVGAETHQQIIRLEVTLDLKDLRQDDLPFRGHSLTLAVQEIAEVPALFPYRGNVQP